MITEILSVAYNDCWSFTVDNTKETVPIIGNDGITVSNFYGPNGRRFKSGDNLNILSLSICAPKNYILENIDSSINTADFDIVSYQQYTASQKLFSTKIGFFNYENSIGQFIDFNNSLGPEYFILSLTISHLAAIGETNSALNISMLNVPDSENGKTYFLQAYMKIQHSLEMY